MIYAKRFEIKLNNPPLPLDKIYLEALHRQMVKPRIIGKDWFHLNRSFHMKLYEMSVSERLFKILQGLWNNTGAYLRIL